MEEQIKAHLQSLGDAELLEYVLTGRRMYQPLAIALAKQELDRRAIPPEKLKAMRDPIVSQLALLDSETAPDPSFNVNPDSIVCDACALEAPTRFVAYQQNIGLIFMRLTKQYAGHFCHTCNRRYFWKATATTFFLGWWGVISFFVTLAFLISNVVQRLKTLSLPRVPQDAAIPSFDDSVIRKTLPFTRYMEDQIIEGADLCTLAREISGKAQVTPGEAWSLLIEMRRQISAAAQAARQPPTRGFPVVMPVLPGRE